MSFGGLEKYLGFRTYDGTNANGFVLNAEPVSMWERSCNTAFGYSAKVVVAEQTWARRFCKSRHSTCFQYTDGGKRKFTARTKRST
jgi:hypothetical protein